MNLLDSFFTIEIQYGIGSAQRQLSIPIPELDEQAKQLLLSVAVIAELLRVQILHVVAHRVETFNVFGS